MNPLIGCSVAGKQEYIDYRVFTHPGSFPAYVTTVVPPVIAAVIGFTPKHPKASKTPSIYCLRFAIFASSGVNRGFTPEPGMQPKTQGDVLFSP